MTKSSVCVRCNKAETAGASKYCIDCKADVIREHSVKSVSKRYAKKSFAKDLTYLVKFHELVKRAESLEKITPQFLLGALLESGINSRLKFSKDGGNKLELAKKFINEGQV